MSLRDAHADTVGKTLTQRPGRDLDTGGQEYSQDAPAFLNEAGESVSARRATDRNPSDAAASKAASSRAPPKVINRSRPNHFGFFGLCLRNLVHSTYAAGAMPSGRPGCPEFRLLHRIKRKRADRVDTKLVDVDIISRTESEKV